MQLYVRFHTAREYHTDACMSIYEVGSASLLKDMDFIQRHSLTTKSNSGRSVNGKVNCKYRINYHHQHRCSAHAVCGPRTRTLIGEPRPGDSMPTQ